MLEKLESTLGKWSVAWVCTDLPNWLEWTAVPILKLILNTQIFIQKLIITK